MFSYLTLHSYPVWPALLIDIGTAIWLITAAFLLPLLKKQLWDDYEPRSLGFFIGTIMLCLSLLYIPIFYGVGYEIASTRGDHQRTVDTTWRQCAYEKIVTMRNSDGESGQISGGLFLISGNIGQTTTYFYYIDAGNGAIQAEQWRPDSDTYLYEEKRTDAYLVQYVEVLKPGKDKRAVLEYPRIVTEFHVPAGTVKKQFNVQ